MEAAGGLIGNKIPDRIISQNILQTMMKLTTKRKHQKKDIHLQKKGKTLSMNKD